jgi:hypothetical protein
MIFKYTTIPTDILDIILEYDGRVKYKHGKYVNIIHKNDTRYDVIQKVITKKLIIMEKNVELTKDGFYFEFGFDVCNAVGLVYDYNFSYKDKFEICYYDWRNGDIKQIRTYI